MFVKSKKMSAAAALLCVTLAAFILAGVAGCAPRVIYTANTLFTDPEFTGRMLSGHSVALLPVLGSNGPLQFEEAELDEAFEILRKARPDLKFIPTYEFETDFSFTLNEPLLYKFYSLLSKEDVLAINADDSVWSLVKQDYLLVYSVKEGMSVRNLDKSVYKQFSIACELWSVKHRAVVWKGECGVSSEDDRTNEKMMLGQSMKRLAHLIPAVQPGYGSESW